MFIEDIYIPAAVTHKDVFLPFAGIYKDKDIVICGTGKTFAEYTFDIDAVHIAINHAIRRHPERYDYFFCSDYDESTQIDITCAEQNPDCIKMYPYYMHPHTPVGTINFIPQRYRQDTQARSFYGLYKDPAKIDGFTAHPNLSVSPLVCYGTTAHFAFEFALWTHPRTIYLVGMDCADGHCEGLGYAPQEGDVPESYIAGWRILKQFASCYYDDVRIQVVRPVGLKDIFPE